MAIRIEKQLQNILLGVIRSECSECFDLTPSSLAPGLFLCDDAGVGVTIYRSTLVNPLPTTNANHLVGIIQTWVSGEPTLRLADNAAKVNGDCPTAISSFVEEMCAIASPFGLPADPDITVSHTVNTCAVVNLGNGKVFTCNRWPDL